jgi:dihydroorotase
MWKPICGWFAVAGMLAAAPAYDLLLKGGHVIDPKNNIDGVMDVAVAGGKVARVAKDIPAAEAARTVNAAGLYVTPGIIDIHAHVYVRSGSKPALGVPPDAFSFRSGVTTLVDAGTAGWRDFPDFRARFIETAKTRVLAFLNISGAGMETSRENDPAEMDAEAAAKMAVANPGVIVGFKSAHFSGEGWPSIDAAVKAGQLAKVPVMVDFGRITKERTLDKLLREKLRPGDIYTHCYAGWRQEVVDGKLNPAMRAGRERGVIFDVGFGAASFFWKVAVPAWEPVSGRTPSPPTCTPAA